MKPVLALIAANVKLRLVVRLPAQTEQFLSITGMLALATNEFRDAFRFFLCNVNTFAVEPIIAQITADIKHGIIVRRLANAVKLLLLRLRQISQLVCFSFGFGWWGSCRFAWQFTSRGWCFYSSIFRLLSGLLLCACHAHTATNNRINILKTMKMPSSFLPFLRRTISCGHIWTGCI